LILQRTWKPWDEISDDLKVAVMAGEDQKFPEHWGFDFSAIQAALAHNELGGSIRGASTLSQQVSKNLFLWAGRSYLRKGLEAWFTALIEVFWPKQRILEVYLNSVEWDDGVFGAEAAARHHFGVSAKSLVAPAGELSGGGVAEPASVERQPSDRLCVAPRRMDSPADEPVGWRQLSAGSQRFAPGTVGALIATTLLRVRTTSAVLH
jgi:hypothetical protein